MSDAHPRSLLHDVLTSRVYDVARETPLDSAPGLSRRLGAEDVGKLDPMPHAYRRVPTVTGRPIKSLRNPAMLWIIFLSLSENSGTVEIHASALAASARSQLTAMFFMAPANSSGRSVSASRSFF